MKKVFLWLLGVVIAVHFVACGGGGGGGGGGGSAGSGGGGSSTPISAPSLPVIPDTFEVSIDLSQFSSARMILSLFDKTGKLLKQETIGQSASTSFFFKSAYASSDKVTLSISSEAIFAALSTSSDITATTLESFQIISPAENKIKNNQAIARALFEEAGISIQSGKLTMNAGMLSTFIQQNSDSSNFQSVLAMAFLVKKVLSGKMDLSRDRPYMENPVLDAYTEGLAQRAVEYLEDAYDFSSASHHKSILDSWASSGLAFKENTLYKPNRVIKWGKVRTQTGNGLKRLPIHEAGFGPVVTVCPDADQIQFYIDSNDSSLLQISKENFKIVHYGMTTPAYEVTQDRDFINVTLSSRLIPNSYYLLSIDPTGRLDDYFFAAMYVYDCTSTDENRAIEDDHYYLWRMPRKDFWDRMVSHFGLPKNNLINFSFKTTGGGGNKTVAEYQAWDEKNFFDSSQSDLHYIYFPARTNIFTPYISLDQEGVDRFDAAPFGLPTFLRTSDLRASERWLFDTKKLRGKEVSPRQYKITSYIRAANINKDILAQREEISSSSLIGDSDFIQVTRPVELGAFLTSLELDHPIVPCNNRNMRSPPERIVVAAQPQNKSIIYCSYGSSSCVLDELPRAQQCAQQGGGCSADIFYYPRQMNMPDKVATIEDSKLTATLSYKVIDMQKRGPDCSLNLKYKSTPLSSEELAMLGEAPALPSREEPPLFESPMDLDEMIDLEKERGGEARNSKKPFPFELFSKAYAAQLPLQPNQPIRQLKVRLPNEAEIQNQIETILLLGSDEEKKKLFISAFEFTLGAEARSPYVQAFKQLVLAKMEQNRHVSTFDMGILKICSQGYLPAQVLKDVFFMDKETLEPADELFLRFAAGFLYEPDDPLREELDTLEGRQRVAQHSWQAMCDVYHYFSSFINFCKDNQCESWGGFKDTFLQMFFAYRNYLLLPPVERNSVSQFIRDLRTAIHQRAAQDPNYLRISEDPDVTKSRLVTFSFLLSDIFLIGMDHLTGLAATHQEYQNMSRNPLLSERELHTRLAMTNLEILLSPPVFIPATNAVVSVVRYNVLLGRQAVMAGRASVTAENVEISWLQETQAYINQNPQWRALQGQIPELSVDQLLAEGSARNILQEAATQRVVVATGVRAASLAADITRTTGLVEGQSAMSALSRVREFLVKLRITRLYTASTVDAPADLAGRFVPGSVTAHSRIAINEFGLNKQVLFDNIMSLKYNVRFGSMRYGRQLYDPFVASSGSAATAEQVRFTLFARSSLKESTQWIYPFPETAKAEIHAFLQGENFQATINWNQFLATLEKHGVITSRDRFAYALQLFTEAHEGKHFFIYAQDFKPFVMRELNILKQSGHAIEEVLQMVEVELAKRGTFSVRAKVLAKIIEMKRGITLTEAQIRQLELICHHAEEKAALQVEAQLAKNLIEADDGLVQGLFQMEGGRARLAAPLRRLLAEDTVLSNPTPLESFTHNTRLLWELLEEAPPAAGSGFDGLFFGTVGQGQIAPDIGLFHGAVDVSAMPNIYEQIINNFAR